IVTVLAYLRNKKMKPKVTEELNFYNSYEEHEIIKYQLKKFNSRWKNIQKEIPYYQELVNKGIVPKSIESASDFQQIPILDRTFARNNIDKLMKTRKSPDSGVSTGGLRGSRLKYRSWKERSVKYGPNIWYARDFYNITRNDKMFRL